MATKIAGNFPKRILNTTCPGNSIGCKWIWSFAKIIISPREPNVASGYARTLLSIRCKWLVQMQAFAEKLSLEHTLHSLQALVNYYYRVKKQRLRKMGLCLLVGRFGGLVSSSIMLLPLTASISDFCPEAFCHVPTGHLLTWISKCKQDICQKTFADSGFDICRIEFLNICKRIKISNIMASQIKLFMIS